MTRINVDDLDIMPYRTHLAWRIRRVVAAFEEQKFRAAHVAAVLVEDDDSLLRRYTPQELKSRICWVLCDMQRRGTVVRVAYGTWKNTEEQA